jgi:hypothetical protein
LTAVLIAVGVFIVVFAAVVTASYILFRWLLPKQEGRPNNLLSILPIFALQLPIENAVTWIWIWLAAVFGLGALWAIWSYVGPWFVRRVSRERPRWDDASPRVRVTGGATRLDLVKGIRPGQQPQGGKR